MRGFTLHFEIWERFRDVNALTRASWWLRPWRPRSRRKCSCARLMPGCELHSARSPSPCPTICPSWPSWARTTCRRSAAELSKRYCRLPLLPSKFIQSYMTYSRNQPQIAGWSTDGRTEFDLCGLTEPFEHFEILQCHRSVVSVFVVVSCPRNVRVAKFIRFKLLLMLSLSLKVVLAISRLIINSRLLDCMWLYLK